MLKEGDNAPAFTLENHAEEQVSLKDFIGQNVILYFYPRDNTPGCTIEAIDFSFLKEKFAKKNTVILGVSKDTCASHQKFIDKKSLTITLLSDPDHKMQETYGVWKPKKFMGREFLGTIRSTFLIDKKGKIVKIWPKVKAKGHAQEVLDNIK